MARTIQQIKTQITDSFLANETIQKTYTLDPTKNFDQQFSKVSLESILFYVVAYAIYALEVLFDTYRTEVNTTIENITPHRPKWYRDKVLKFMENTTLIEDTDDYDLTNLTEDEIASRQIIKHAVATEPAESSILLIKVAGETNNKRTPITPAQETQLRAYLSEIKDAGVRYSLVNQEADTFNCNIDIYYDPMRLPSEVQSECENTITDYIENLPFNGEYTNMALIDHLQGIDGIRIAELKSCSSSTAGSSSAIAINARCTPVAGYFQKGTYTLNMIPYDQEV